MAEFKKNFLKSKMNKDLDERLIPNGQYRDALNIQISSSEDNNTGSAQNLKGNELVTTVDQNNGSLITGSLAISDNAFTVASFSDETNKRIYNFVHKASDLVNNGTYNGVIRKTGVVSDCIFEFNAYQNQNGGFTRPVLTDVFEVRSAASVQETQTIIEGLATVSSNIYEQESSHVPLGIRVGMRVQKIDLSGHDIWGADNEVFVKKILPSTENNGRIEITAQSGFFYNQIDIDNGVVLKFTSPRILNFNDGLEQVEANTTGTPTTPTPKNNIITGINLINDILYFTDNKTEPKKVSLKRFRNSRNSIYEHSIHSWQDDNGNSIQTTLKESLITVIKQNPLTQPKIVTTVNDRVSEEITEIGGLGFGVNDEIIQQNQGVFYSTITFGSITSNFQSETGEFGNFAFANEQSEPFTPDPSQTNGQPDIITIQCSVAFVNWRIGDVLELVGQTTASQATVQIVGSSSAVGYNKFNVRLVNLSEAYTGSEPAETWNATLKNKKKLYEDDFVCFAYRYKYVDGEYSAISPYSDIAFVPGFYSFNPLKGFNDGMENKVQDIKVLDFIPPYIPDDVQCVDLLFKKTNSTLVHVIETFKRGSSEWNTIGTPFTNYKGNVTISSEVFGKTLEESQSLRIFDNVPIKARSQEIIGSRLAFGNYHENYDIVDETFRKITPSIGHFLQHLPITFTEVFTATNEFSSAQGGEGTPVGELMANSNIYSYSAFTNTSAQPIGLIADEAADQFDDLSFGGANNTSPDFPQGLQTSTLWGIPTFEENDPDNNFNNQIPVGQSTAVDAATDFSVQAKGPYFQAPTGGNYTFTAKADAAVIKRPFDQVSSTGVISTTFSLDCKGTKFGLFKVDQNGIWEDWDNIHIGDNMDINHPSVFSDSLSTINMKITSSAPVRDYTSHEFTITVYLNAGEKVAAGFCHNKAQLENYTAALRLKNCTFSCTNAPDNTEELITEQAKSSVKSIRTYEIGVVYVDKHGRESAVQLDKTNSLRVRKDHSDLVNRLSAKIYNKAPYWADYYKFYLKEIASKYHNLVLYKAYPTGNNEEGFFNNVWLVFNSADRSKVKIGSYLIQKKQHGNSIAVNSEDAKYRVLDIVGNAAVETETDDEGNATQQISIGTGTSALDLTALGADFNDVNGKFFVKIEAEDEFQLNINNDEEGISFITDDENINNGAVFEVVDEQKVDLDLFYEVSQAYPINLLGEKASVLIKAKDTITLESGFNAPTTSAFNQISGLLKVETVIGASSLGTNQINFQEEGKVVVYTNQNFPTFFGSNDFNNSVPQILRFTRSDGSYYTLRAVGLNSGNKLLLYPYTHKTSANTNFSSKFLLRFVNCFSFGNGVESDRIRDDFNASTMYSYTSAGKQSGFKASTPDADYQRDHKENDIIFSQIINEATGINRANEFLMAENIVKRLNPEYGSIQKLFTRNTDLLAFCENKVLKILAQKDALFNADGNPQLLSTNRVLGQAIPYIGDYGISKNPESFASDEFRCYFTDVDRGAVCRLSRDGITAVSDFGMKNFFYDNLKNSTVCIGDFDGRKDEYNITIHTDNADVSGQKNVYTVSYGERVKGWTSFKSFIKEQGATLNNRYYTFKDGKMWLHHYNETHNNFYGTQFNSTIDVIFNNSPSVVKSFSTLNYEGTQSRVIANTQDEAFYNLTAKNGWYVESINTDLQEGAVDEFIDKENKWFNFIKGITTSHTNLADGAVTSNLDFNENTLQGIGQISANATSDTVGFGEGFDVSVTLSTSSDQQFTSTGFSVNNISTLPSTGTFTIVPTQGYSIAASQFSLANTLPSFISGITFADTGVGGTLTNTVVATITFTGSITEDLSHAVQVNTTSFASIATVQAVLTIVGAGINQPNGETVSVSFGQSEAIGLVIPIPSTMPNSVSYLITGYTGNNNGTDLPFVTVSLYSGPFHFYSTENLATMTVTPFLEADNYEIQQVDSTSILNAPTVLTSQTYDIFYNNSDENVTVDDNNDIVIYTNSTPVNCKFSAFPEESGFAVAQFDDNNDINNRNVPIINNIPANPSVKIIDGGLVSSDGIDWISPQFSLQQGVLTDDTDPSVLVTVNYLQNVTLNNCNFNLSVNTGSTRDLLLRLFSAVNNTGTPDDVLLIRQIDVQTLDAKVKFQIGIQPQGPGPNPGNVFPLYSELFDHLDGTNSSLSGSSGPKLSDEDHGIGFTGSVGIFNNQGEAFITGTAPVVVQANSDQGVFSATNFTLSYISGGEFIDGLPNGSNLEGMFTETGFGSVAIPIPENNTEEDRSIKVIVTHPIDNSLTDEVVITQRAAYSSSNNTLIFKNNTGGQEGPPIPNSAPNLVAMQQFFDDTDPVEEIVLSSSAISKFIYMKIPNEDFAEIQDQYNIDLLNDPDLVMPGPTLVFQDIFNPGSGQVEVEDGVFQENVGLNPETGEPDQGIGDEPFLTYGNVEVSQPIQYYSGNVLLTYNFLAANYKVLLNVQANDYVIPGDLLPRDRTFKIKGRHPYNVNGASDSVIQIRQLAEDRCEFADNSNPTIYNSNFNGEWQADVSIHANNSVPRCVIYKYEQHSLVLLEDGSPNVQTFLGAPDWAANLGNLNQTSISSNSTTLTNQDYIAQFTFTPPIVQNIFYKVYIKAVHGDIELNGDEPAEDSLVEDTKFIQVNPASESYFYVINPTGSSIDNAESTNAGSNVDGFIHVHSMYMITSSVETEQEKSFDLVFSGPAPEITSVEYFKQSDAGTSINIPQTVTNQAEGPNVIRQGFDLASAPFLSTSIPIALIESDGNEPLRVRIKVLINSSSQHTSSGQLDGVNIRVNMSTPGGLQRQVIVQINP